MRAQRVRLDPAGWRKVCRRYVITADYGGGPPEREMASFPSRAWFAVTALLFVRDGSSVTLEDGTRATVEGPPRPAPAPGARRQEWTEKTRDMLLLVGVDVPLETVHGWSAEHRAAAQQWATREHLSAAGSWVRRLPRPGFLDQYTGSGRAGGAGD